MAFVDGTIEQHASDGLSCVQRALVRYVTRAKEPVRCSTVIESLLGSPDCPTDATWETIDCAMLVMCHPRICSSPLFQYAGGLGASDGFMPGSVYRMVWGSAQLRGVLSREPSGDLWDPAPLSVTLPIALLSGCASWEVEMDDRFPADKREQAMVRARCVAVHCLGSDEVSVYNAMKHAREYRDVGQSLTFAGPDGPPLGCLNPDVQSAIDRGISLRRDDETTVCRLWGSALPHGTLAGVRLQVAGDAIHSEVSILSLPRLNRPFWARSPGFILEQAACGRHMGDELDLARTLPGCRIADQETPRLDPGGSVDPMQWAQSVELRSLSVECYQAMLGR